MQRVLIVDDEDNFRSIVKEILTDEAFYVAEASDGLIAVEIFKNSTIDAVLLDLRMPHMDGIETMSELRKINPHIPVIILTAFGDIPTAVETVKQGAYDFITKPPEFDELISIIKRAVEMRRPKMEAIKRGPPVLTNREKEVLKWLKEGKSTWDISKILRISRYTVDFHIKNLFRKLSVVNRTQAVSEAFRQGIISEE
ncbi:MAG: response regulator transcription factor [Bacteroidetes bacterium]|nr:MAG: response regulator transcription factor [Bacteroidota bacterium]